MFDDTETTPTVVDPCPECGRELVRVKDDVPAPTTLAEALMHTNCEATRSRLWSWCSRTFWLKICFSRRSRERS